MEGLRARQLRLFAAHDVGRAERIRAAHAGHDADTLTYDDRVFRQFVKVGWAG